MANPQYYHMNRGNPQIGMRPPAPPNPGMYNHSGTLGMHPPPQVPKPQEEKIEINDMMIKNLKILKNPSKMIEILKLEKDVLQKLIIGIANENPLSLVVHNIKVREIWVGNLNVDTTEADVRNAFSVYGKIENIEMFNKSNQNQIFAFLKYFRVSHAAKAFENIDNLSVAMKLNLRISYSDFSKRNNVVGDSATVDDNIPDLTPFVFLSYNSGVQLPKAKSLGRKLLDFGKIKNILMKPSYDTNYKSFILVEFETVEQAIRVRKYFFLNDKNSKRRFKLGSRDIDVNILTKVAEFRKFELTPQMLKKDPSSGDTNAKINMIKSKLKQKTVNEEIQEIFDIKTMSKVTTKSRIPDIEILPLEYKENRSIINRYELMWSGVVYRGKKKHFLGDARYVAGDRELAGMLPDRLILSHKTTMKEVLSRRRVGVVVITPSNSVTFKEYLDILEEFQNYDMVAITYQIKKTVFYLLPYHDKLKDYVPELDPNCFVGVFVERGDSESEDANNKLAGDSEDGTVVMLDKKDSLIKRSSEYSNIIGSTDDFDSDNDNYSESNSNQDSPEESDKDGEIN